MATVQEAASGTGGGRELRAHARCPVDEDASVLLLTLRQSLRCRIVELSLSGCRIRTQEPLRVPPGAPIEIHFKVNGIVFRFRGAIEWADCRKETSPKKPHIEAGVRFPNSLPRQAEDLGVVLEELEARARRKAAEDCPSSAQQAGQPADLPEQAPADQPAKDLAAPGSTTSQPQVGRPARERRVQAREPVDTSAVIFLVKSGSRLEGRILDLSLAGCGIRLDEAYSRGIYMRAEVEFRLEGLPFRLGGVIQSIRDKRTVGIRFLDVSERKQSQVNELIAELRELHEAKPESNEGAAGDH
jgi:PilZ domain